MNDVSRYEALAKIIQINIVTYNRAAYLDRTLKALMEGPFRHVGINIFDNCSTDATIEICNRFNTNHENIRIIRHTENIGAVGNVLRSMELSPLKYTWFLCDDDIFDFSICSDLIDALLSGEFDLIVVGAPGKLPFEWGLKSKFTSLFKSNTRLFHVLSFLPSAIYRSSLVDSSVLQQGYSIGGDMFPQLAIAGSLISKDVDVYTIKHPLVKQDYADQYPWTPLQIFSCWVRTCRRVIPQPTDRRQVIYEMISNSRFNYGPAIFFVQMAKIIAIEKAQVVPIRNSINTSKASAFDIFLQIFIGCNWEQRLLLALHFPFLLFPSKFYILSRNIYRWLKYTLRGKTLPSNNENFQLTKETEQ